MRIRAARIEDVPAMMEIERQNPSAAHWSREQYENLFVIANGQPDVSERLVWVIEKEGDARAGGLGDAPEILAFLVGHRVKAEWELENIVVADMVRRQGFGTQLLQEFILHAQAKGGSGIFLEVRESNQNARKLYQSLGFEEAGVRRNYYASPVENAILYHFRKALS